MILHEFPDLKWLKRQTESRFRDQISPQGVPLPTQGWPTVILDVDSATTYRDDIRGPISLFTNLTGESGVSVQGKSVVLKGQAFFLSNQDQRYTLEIHQKKRAETFNIHFGECFAEKVFGSLRRRQAALLDDDNETTGRIHFYNQLRQRSLHLEQLIQEMKLQLPKGMALEEKLVDIMTELVLSERSFAQQISAVETVKAATRQEIVRRLMLATDYIQSHYDRDLSLDEVAAASCLSKFHFLRLFKLTFRQTPHQYLNAVRVRRGQALLRTTRLSVIDIARSVGFDNASSFSRMFFSQTGSYPTQWR